MQNATKLEKTTMLSVVGLEDSVIQDICLKCNVQVANYLFPKGRVLSGKELDIEKAKQLAEENNCTRAKILLVSGAFHSTYMEPAQEELEKALEEISINELQCKVYANVDALEYTKETVKDKLSKQLVSSVKWEDLFKNTNANKFYEVGSGNQLKSMMRRIDMVKWKNTINV